MHLESELQPDSAESTYVRVIVWNTMPTSEHLQCHFDKFDLLQLEEERLASGKFDIIQKSESTYERFLYAHYPEQESTITIFVKVNFKSEPYPFSLKALIKKVYWAFKKYMIGDDENEKYSSSLKSFIEKVDGAFKKYGLGDNNESVPEPEPEPIIPNIFLLIGFTVVILIISSLYWVVRSTTLNWNFTS
jgi:hypothetical protein